MIKNTYIKPPRSTKHFIEVLKFLLLIIPFIQPSMFNYFNTIETIYNVSKIIASVIIIFIFIFNNNKISLMMMAILLFRIILLIPTVINDGNISNWFYITAYIVALCMLIENYIKLDIITMLDGLSLLFEILIYINFITLIVFPTGLRFINSEKNIFFLGSPNNMVRIILPGICFSLIRSEILYKKIKIRYIVLLLVSFYTLLITWSVTAIIGMSIVIIGVFIFKIKNLPGFINFWTAFFSSFTLFYFVVIKRIMDFAADLLSKFEKTITFTGRTFLWDNAIMYIKQAPFFGWGIENNNTLLYKIGNINGSHNYYLDVLYRGGVLLFIALLFILVLVGKKISQEKENNISKIFLLIFFSYFIMWISEPFYNNEHLMFMIFLLAFHLKKIINVQCQPLESS